MAISQHVLFRETKRGLIRFLFFCIELFFPIEHWISFAWASSWKISFHLLVWLFIFLFLIEGEKNVGSVLFKWIDVDLYQKSMWKRIRKIADSVVSIRNLKWKSMILIMNCQKIYEECCGVYAVGNFRNSKVIEAYVQTKCRRYTRMVKCCLALTISNGNIWYSYEL